MSTSSEFRWVLGPTVAITLVGSLLLAVSFLRNGGCKGRGEPDPEAVARYKQELGQKEKERQTKAAQTRKRLRALREEMTRRENAWRGAVLARHPEWTEDQQRKNLDYLLRQWGLWNSGTVEKTVEAMGGLGKQSVRHEMVEADFRDIATQRFAIQDILYGEFKELRAELEKVDKVQGEDDWWYLYHPD